MASRFRAWLRRKLKLSGKTQYYQETASGGLKPQIAAPSTQKESLPPPYATLDLMLGSIDGTERIEVLRARNPITQPRSKQSPILHPPQHMTTPRTAAKAAASAAVVGMIRALDEPNPRMVAARTAQAIAVAVSTSRSYAAFVAAVTAAESSALLLIERAKEREAGLPHPWSASQRQKNAIYAAAVTAMAADAGITPIGSWPFNIHRTHLAESSSQTDFPSSSAD